MVDTPQDGEIFDPASPALPLDGSGPDEVSAAVTPRHDRLSALVEVLLCSGIPTQLVIAQALTLAGWRPFTAGGEPQAGPLFAFALVDTIVLLGLMAAFQRARGHTLRALLLGTRPVAREAWLGLALVPALFLGVGVVVLALRNLLPWLHNVPTNPFEQLIRTPRDAWLFAVVAIVAGGLREEVQRAFLLQRIAAHLGGPTVALTVVSVGFGAGHLMQGLDAAVATGLLGLAWGLMFQRRRSAVAPIVSHAGYNSAQLLQLMLIRRMAL